MTQQSGDYRKMTDQLKVLLDAMQDENTDVDESMKNYEAGQKLIKQLEKYLLEAENKLISTDPSTQEKARS